MDVNLFGSFFPVWMISAMLGIAFTAMARLVLVRSGLQDSVGPRALIYPSLAMFFTFGIWLTFFS